MSVPKHPTPTLLIILDGFGLSEDPSHNAIAQARTPNWDAYWSGSARTRLDASGHAVGLPAGQMGNSEVGHLNIGAGRLVEQDLMRIGEAQKSHGFEDLDTVKALIAHATSAKSTIHLMGLVSDGGVHSHLDHLLQLIHTLGKAGLPIAVHAFLDGRDVPPKSAEPYLRTLADTLASYPSAGIATIGGRYYGMDRDQRWERLEKAYQAMVMGRAEHTADDALTALQMAYARDETDEFVLPTCIGAPRPIQPNDVILHANFRADRARQLTQALTQADFSGFATTPFPYVVTMTEYAQGLTDKMLFPPFQPKNVFGEVLSKAGLKQLRVAETEKYAHVTFFFNGGREAPFPGEDRKLIPSPKVATYDEQPEMSLPEVTKTLVQAIQSQAYDVIITNFANADMVGHTGSLPAAIAAIEAVDKALGEVKAALDAVGGQALITADHGNAETMYNGQTEQPHTAHTTNLVPLVYWGPDNVQLREQPGTLADIAPTLLSLMGQPIPDSMTGDNLSQRTVD